MKNSLLLIVFQAIVHLSVFGQGSVLLVGGGAEENTPNSWCAVAYKWAVEKSVNKKVAILDYGTETSSWMRDYFTQNCGASAAKHFNLSNSTVINADATYTELMQYDVFFIKGGDQYNYYSGWKNTKTQLAIDDKFKAGGVICGTSAGMAILSDVMFTAQNGTVYPEDCLKDANSSTIVLKNDFLQLFSHTLFDTHFVQRGRFARLIVFIINYLENNGTKLTGIGVDDLTALAIDQNKQAKVFGTGAVTIIHFETNSEGGIQQNIPFSHNLRVAQLLQNCSIDLNTMQIDGFENETPLKVNEFNGNYTVFASGSNLLADNTEMLSDFLSTKSELNNKILIITGSNADIALMYAGKLKELGATDVEIVNAVLENISNDLITEKIEKSAKILFVNNSAAMLPSFTELGTSGAALKKQIRKDGFISAFVGDNARLAGKTVINNYLTENAAYQGKLTFTKGLSLIDGVVFQPVTFQNSTLHENTAASIPYSMVRDSLFMGIWLDAGNYVKFYPSANKTYLSAFGTMPVMLLKSKGTQTGLATQTALGNGTQSPRNIAGFAAMTCDILKTNTPYLVGNNVVSDFKEDKSKTGMFQVYPVPASDILKIDAPDVWYSFDLYAIDGKKVLGGRYFGNTIIELNTVESGNYIYKAQNENGGISSGKIVISK